MQISNLSLDKTEHFEGARIIHQYGNQVIWIVYSSDVPDDDSFIFEDDVELQLIYGDGEDVKGYTLKDFSFTYELANATILSTIKK